MINFEREVKDLVLIEEMLKMFNIVNVGINGDDGYPYVVPLNFGFEVKDNKFIFYTHFMKRGLKVDLIKKNPKVCLEFSAFNDFPDHKYKGHCHDYRSVIAKGTMKLIDGNKDYETFKRGYDLLYLCNNREIKSLENRPAIPPMYIGMVECDLANITAKSEFPLHSVEDVPFIDVYSKEAD